MLGGIPPSITVRWRVYVSINVANAGYGEEPCTNPQLFHGNNNSGELSKAFDYANDTDLCRLHKATLLDIVISTEARKWKCRAIYAGEANLRYNAKIC